MQCPKAALFDLDNTLSEPFRPVSGAMAASFARLIGTLPVAIMTAASFERVQQDVLSQLPPSTNFSSLSLFTANGGQAYTFEAGVWKPCYHFEFSDAQLSKIRQAIEQSVAETNALEDTKVYGEQFVNYKGYFAFTALGVGAPVQERRAWDPDFLKRARLRAAVEQKLPEFEVYIGGSTSIDVTFKGINKAYGIRWLSEHLKMLPSDMFYVGDALYQGGNDFVVIVTGVQTWQTKNPEETLGIIDELLTSCATQ